MPVSMDEFTEIGLTSDLQAYKLLKFVYAHEGNE